MPYMKGLIKESYKNIIRDFCLLLGCYGLVYGVICIFDLCTGWWKGIAMGVWGTLFYEAGHVWYVQMRRKDL